MAVLDVPTTHWPSTNEPKNRVEIIAIHRDGCSHHIGHGALHHPTLDPVDPNQHVQENGTDDIHIHGIAGLALDGCGVPRLGTLKKKDVASISDTCSGRSASGNKAHRDSNNIRAALKVWWRVRDFQVCHEVGKCPGVAMHVQYAAQCIAKLPGTPVLISASEHFPISKPIPKIEPAYLPDACPKHGASNSNPPQETPHMQVTDPTTDVELQAEGGDMIKVSSVRLIKNH
jgi:hypothetical protein